MTDPWADPDWLRDTAIDRQLDDEIACATCGHTDPADPASHLTALSPSEVRYGPVAAVRGICGACREGRRQERAVAS